MIAFCRVPLATVSVFLRRDLFRDEEVRTTDDIERVRTFCETPLAEPAPEGGTAVPRVKVLIVDGIDLLQQVLEKLRLDDVRLLLCGSPSRAEETLALRDRGVEVLDAGVDGVTKTEYVYSSLMSEFNAYLQRTPTGVPSLAATSAPAPQPTTDQKEVEAPAGSYYEPKPGAFSGVLTEFESTIANRDLRARVHLRAVRHVAGVADLDELADAMKPAIAAGASRQAASRLNRLLGTPSVEKLFRAYYVMAQTKLRAEVAAKLTGADLNELQFIVAALPPDADGGWVAEVPDDLELLVKKVLAKRAQMASK